MDLKIVAFGNPLLDTIVLSKDDFLLKKHNLLVDGQKEITLDEMKILKEDIKNLDKTIAAGGCAQNTLKVFQWLFQQQCSATIVGSVGNDKEGEKLKEILKEHGVETNYVIQKNYPTGTTVSLVSGECRSLVAHLGAAEVLSLHDINKNSNVLNEIQSADLVYIEGFFLTKRFETAAFILKHCLSLNKKFAFNLSGEYLCRENPKEVEYFIEKADIIFGNKKEFETLYGTKNENGLKSLIANLSNRGKIVAVTNGSSSVLCAGDCGNTFTEVEVPSLEQNELIDTTGAGDAFVAGFLCAFLQKKSLMVCCRLGCYAAQEIIKQRGCTVPNYLPNFV